MKLTAIRLCLILLSPLLFSACEIIRFSSRNAGHPPPPPKEDVSDANYRTRIGDVLSVRCLEDNTVDIQQVISQEGELDLAYVNRVKVTGKTVHELKDLFAKVYKDANLFVNPHFNVTVVGYAPRLIQMSGQLGRGGISVPYSPTEGITFFKAVMAAGGISPRGNPRDVLLYRVQPKLKDGVPVVVDGKPVTEKVEYHISFSRILYNNDDDFDLAENDLIHVKEDLF